jgi:hypothetical protein
MLSKNYFVLSILLEQISLYMYFFSLQVTEN